MATGTIIDEHSIIFEVGPFSVKLSYKLLHEHTEHFVVVNYLSDRHVDPSVRINSTEHVQPRSDPFLCDTVRLTSEPPLFSSELSVNEETLININKDHFSFHKVKQSLGTQVS
jgi:hypothetical protein